MKVVVAITSPIAFELLVEQSVLQSAFDVASAFSNETYFSNHLAIATDNRAKIAHFGCEILECNPNDPASFAAALKHATPCDVVAIHDSQRPLTRITQFHRVLEALTVNIDAVRPASAFTETLKAVNVDGIIERTIDRTSMKRISAPEIIRFSAIDFQGKSSTWFIPLKDDAKTSTVDAEPESLRVNSTSELLLARTLVKLN